MKLFLLLLLVTLSIFSTFALEEEPFIITRELKDTIEQNFGEDAKGFFKRYGIQFSPDSYVRVSGVHLFVKETPKNIELIKQMINEYKLTGSITPLVTPKAKKVVAKKAVAKKKTVRKAAVKKAPAKYGIPYSIKLVNNRAKRNQFLFIAAMKKKPNQNVKQLLINSGVALTAKGTVEYNPKTMTLSVWDTPAAILFTQMFFDPALGQKLLATITLPKGKMVNRPAKDIIAKITDLAKDTATKTARGKAGLKPEFRLGVNNYVPIAIRFDTRVAKEIKSFEYGGPFLPCLQKICSQAQVRYRIEGLLVIIYK